MLINHMAYCLIVRQAINNIDNQSGRIDTLKQTLSV